MSQHQAGIKTLSLQKLLVKTLLECPYLLTILRKVTHELDARPHGLIYQESYKI